MIIVHNHLKRGVNDQIQNRGSIDHTENRNKMRRSSINLYTIINTWENSNKKEFKVKFDWELAKNSYEHNLNYLTDNIEWCAAFQVHIFYLTKDLLKIMIMLLTKYGDKYYTNKHIAITISFQFDPTSYEILE